MAVNRNSHASPSAQIDSGALGITMMVPEPVLNQTGKAKRHVLAWMIAFPGVVLSLYLYIPFYKGAISDYAPVDVTVLLALICVLNTIPLLWESWNSSMVLAFTVWSSVIFVVLAGTLYAVDSRNAESTIIEFLSLVYIPLLLAIRVARDNSYIDQVIQTTIYVSVICVVFGLISISDQVGYSRIGGLSNTINLGRSALLVVVLIPALLQMGNRRLRHVGIAASPFAVAVAIASASRGPLLMCIVTLVLVYVVGRSIGVKPALAAVVVMAAIVFLLNLPALRSIIPEQSMVRIQTLTDIVLEGGELDSSSATRVELLGVAARMFQDRPLIGWGTAGFEAVSQTLPGSFPPTYPHNWLMQALSEFGIIGSIPIIVLLVGSMSLGWKRRSEARYGALLSLGLFALLNGLVSNSLYDNRWMWGMAILVIAASAHTIESKVGPQPTVEALGIGDRVTNEESA